MARYREEPEPSTPFQKFLTFVGVIFLIGIIILTVAAYKAFPASVGFAKLLLGLAIPLMTLWSAVSAVFLVPIAVTFLGGGALVGASFIIKSIFSLFRRRERAESDIDKAAPLPSRSPERPQGGEPPTRHAVLDEIQRAETERRTQPNRGTQYRNER